MLRRAGLLVVCLALLLAAPAWADPFVSCPGGQTWDPDARTCVKETSRHVFYPVFGVAGQPEDELAAVLDRLEEYVRTLAPEADISRQLL